jgi:hypothetical protein
MQSFAEKRSSGRHLLRNGDRVAEGGAAVYVFVLPRWHGHEAPCKEISLAVLEYRRLEAV